ncbi:MAG TPA: chemoreceptor glutamine deamidase CheD, partial [Burkholderiaceae bacterium]|nr:chemoreceptor glutamine deamidase CheD [Burkholderiaceae bacterium]
VAKIGGMNHFMLPAADAGHSLAGSAGRCGVFAMEQLINEPIKRGAAKATLEAKVFGGASARGSCSMLNVGECNASFVLQFLGRQGIRVASQDLLNVYVRCIAFFPSSGRALCKRLHKTDSSMVAAKQQYFRKNQRGGGRRRC